MKSLILVLSLLGAQAMAAPAAEVPATEPAKVLQKKSDATTTSHNFEDLLVQGKYHFSEEAVTTVEDDKVHDSLIGVRSDIKDRLKSSTGSY